jgi:hypothetical protein
VDVPLAAEIPRSGRSTDNEGADRHDQDQEESVSGHGPALVSASLRRQPLRALSGAAPLKDATPEA